MIATYDSKSKILNVRGQHKPNTPRYWTVKIDAYKEGIRHRLVLRPESPCTMHDVHDYIMAELDQIKPDHVRWEAIAR